MSLARQHRERTLAAQSADSAASEGGLTIEPVAERRVPAPGEPGYSLARAHKARVLGLGFDAAAVAAATVAVETNTGSPEDQAAQQIMLRLIHDLRRLKEIKSIDAKVAAKREMLPAYRDWVIGVLTGAAERGAAVPEEVTPTIMVWLIDVGMFDDALQLAAHVLRFGIPMPGRYERDAASLITEEIATAALAAQLAGETFDLEVLRRVETMTAEADMHDQIRAKLLKAIGFELARVAEGLDPASPDLRTGCEAALVPLRRAVQLNARVGAKEKIKRLEKLLEAAPALQA
jgi:hypothetical protein